MFPLTFKSRNALAYNRDSEREPSWVKKVRVKGEKGISLAPRQAKDKLRFNSVSRKTQLSQLE